jgi:hypothetical protein
MTVGDYFVAGGWSGKVKSIVPFEPPTLNEGEKGNKEKIILDDKTLFSRGASVKVIASLHSDCKEPRPLGETVHFFSLRGHGEPASLDDKNEEAVSTMMQTLTNKQKKDVQQKLKELSEEFMDFNQMIHSFGK